MENICLDKACVQQLIEQAFEARKRSYCRYSGFAVGAALLAEDGSIYTGCNIENAAFSPTNCAERTAFFKAVSEGVRDFRAIAVVGGEKGLGIGEVDFCTPCGVCRQVMAEFCKPDFSIIMAKDVETYRVQTLQEVLPGSFSLKMDGEA